MYKCVQEIVHLKIGSKHMPSAQIYVTELQSTQHNPMNICEGDLYQLLSFPAELTSCPPAQSHL